MKNQALLVIDIQNDFTGDYAKMPVNALQASQMIDNLNKLIDETDTEKRDILYIGNEYDRWDVLNVFRNYAAIKGTEGTQLDKRLRVVNNTYFSKNKGNAFSNQELDKYLKTKNINELWISGLYAEACIYATVKGALKRNYKVIVLSDCIATKSDEKRDKIIKKYKKIGAEVQTASQFFPSN